LLYNPPCVVIYILLAFVEVGTQSVKPLLKREMKALQLEQN